MRNIFVWLTCVVFWIMVIFMVFCVRDAAGAANETDEPMAQIIRGLVVAAEGNEWDPNVHDSAKHVRYAGIDNVAGIDPERVLMLDKPEEQDPVPELISLGTYTITAYCACQKCCGKSPDDPWYGITATGTRATQGRTIAADPAVLPYGTLVVINGHVYTVEDCGGAIDGKEIDMFFDDHQTAREWGNQYWEVFTYEK